MHWKVPKNFSFQNISKAGMRTNSHVLKWYKSKAQQQQQQQQPIGGDATKTITAHGAMHGKHITNIFINIFI